jgi:hypothetical protein
MISRFVNLFKKNDLDEQRAFQHMVHKLASELFPEKKIEICDDPLTLLRDGGVVGITNLKAEFLLSSKTDAVLKELIQSKFGLLFAKPDDEDDSNWETVKSMLMPQLMPESFVRRAPIELVHKQFGDDVSIGIVIDSESSYAYANVDNIDAWGVGVDEIFETALENLNERSRGIAMEAFPGKNGFFVVNTMDGFDAARIFLPKLQDLIAEHLGLPFYAGVPNRDFLICWSKAGDADFQESMRSQVAKDSEERPYPLSGKVFEVSENGHIEVAAIGEIDPRAETAELN